MDDTRRVHSVERAEHLIGDPQRAKYIERSLIFEDVGYMDFEKRIPVVKQICAKVYDDAPTNVTDVAQLLEPTNNRFGGWIGTLGGTNFEDSYLNLRPT